MKTPKEWAEEFLKTKEWWPIKGTFEWIAAIQADASAGMVHEGELEQMRTRAEMWERNAHASEAELAKAWEAGKQATLEATAAFVPAVVWSEIMEKLQPPGGKAK